jgi:hypothetical protein
MILIGVLPGNNARPLQTHDIGHFTGFNVHGSELFYDLNLAKPRTGTSH